ncbi:hypothetical protein [Holdemania sp. Marseille-P2844]|uniref:hypothetical protein n=1 Tax=Holdemania sp. Marseille-P2844 TaxID=1852366 RepID=UPI000932EBA9|nr:hypothetical protein [Holdemania sp. Marseille-P2844]
MGEWNGKKTKYLDKISHEHCDLFGMFPDGNFQFDPNFLDYDLYVELIELAIKYKIPAWDILGDEYLRDT